MSPKHELTQFLNKNSKNDVLQERIKVFSEQLVRHTNSDFEHLKSGRRLKKRTFILIVLY
jgi:hypothetical protein